MALRLSQSTMEARQVSFTNCMFSTKLSKLSSNMISIAASVFYWFIAASIAELASAMPSAGGGSFNRRSFGTFARANIRVVYHWASVTAGPYGRLCGWFAGWWNFLAWVLGLTGSCQIMGSVVVSMYALFHPDYVIHRWQVFVAYQILLWSGCLVVLYLNRALPTLESLGGFLTVAGGIVTILVCAIMPHMRNNGYASSEFVWHEWVNSTGYTGNGFVFCLGMLNGAFTVGTPDVITHLAEEIPKCVWNSLNKTLSLTQFPDLAKISLRAS
jgi:choline transport protein